MSPQWTKHPSGCLYQTSNSFPMKNSDVQARIAKLQAMVDMYNVFGADAYYNSEEFTSMSCDMQMMVTQEIEDLS